MQFPNDNTAVATIECSAALSDRVLQAARKALSPDAIEGFYVPPAIQALPAKQQPLVPLLMALIDSAKAIAKAIADNAWDDSMPLPQSLADEMAQQCRDIACDITNATECPNASAWSLPSMTGKELV